MYKIGDRYTPGAGDTEIEITRVDALQVHYKYTKAPFSLPGEYSMPIGGLGAYTMVYREYQIDFSLAKPDIKPECKCSGYDLLHKGCICGAIKKQKWGI